MGFDHIAGRTGNGRHDDGVFSRQPVHQAGLPHIGRSSQHDPQTFPEPLPLLAAFDLPGDRLGEPGDSVIRFSERCFVHMRLIDEVDGGFEPRQDLDEVLTPAAKDAGSSPPPPGGWPAAAAVPFPPR